MAKSHIELVDGKWVVVTDSVHDLKSQDDDSYVAVLNQKRKYEVFATEEEASNYLLVNGGGRLYRLSHYDYKGGQERLPRSQFIKEINGYS